MKADTEGQKTVGGLTGTVPGEGGKGGGGGGLQRDAGSHRNAGWATS